MKKILVAIFLLLNVFSMYAFSADNKIIFNDSKYAEKYYESLKRNIDVAELNLGIVLTDLTVEINIGEGYLNNSHSDAKKACHIFLNYMEDRPFLFNTMEDELKFTLWHELGHCILGKKIFYVNFDWVIPVENEDRLNKEIDFFTKLSIDSLNCISCKDKIFMVAPPIVVYHEMYADVLSLSIFLKNGGNIDVVEKLKYIREEQFKKDGIKSLYASQFSIDKLIDYFRKNNKIDILECSKIFSQKGFLEYLKIIDNYGEKYE